MDITVRTRWKPSYLRVRPLDFLTGASPVSSTVVAEVANLRSRNVLFVVGLGLSSASMISSASAMGEVPSAGCGVDIEAEAMGGSNAGVEPGFGACVLRFLGTEASSQ